MTCAKNMFGSPAREWSYLLIFLHQFWSMVLILETTFCGESVGRRAQEINGGGMLSKVENILTFHILKVDISGYHLRLSSCDKLN